MILLFCSFLTSILLMYTFPEYGFCAILLVFCCAYQYFTNIQFKKHTLELNYYLQVNLSQFFFFSHLTSAILVATTLNSMRYIICPKHSFYVTHPSLLSIEPDFPFTWPRMYWEHTNGHLEQTLGEEKSQTLISLNIDMSEAKSFRPFTSNTFKEVEQDQHRVIPLSTK